MDFRYISQGIRQRLHIVICLESESHHTEELFEDYSSLYKCTEIVWMASTAIASPDYVAKELIDKFCGENVPAPKYLNMIEIGSTEWNRSAYRFQNLIFTYGTIYKNMLFSIQKQQNILQVKINFNFSILTNPKKSFFTRLASTNYHQPMKWFEL